MFALPMGLLHWLCRRGIWIRPRYLLADVSEAPDDSELPLDLVLREVRSRHPKWMHLRCPQCHEHIQLAMAGTPKWELEVDFLRRPTLSPSIWQVGGCGAHFFIERGAVVSLP